MLKTFQADDLPGSPEKEFGWVTFRFPGERIRMGNLPGSPEKEFGWVTFRFPGERIRMGDLPVPRRKNSVG
jgi:hypothetical protein